MGNIGIPKIGALGIPDLGKKFYNVCAILDDKEFEKAEKVIFTYDNEEMAITQKDNIFKNGIQIKSKDGAFQVFYPPSQVRRVIIRKETSMPSKTKSNKTN